MNLSSRINKALILNHNEDIELLKRSLILEGFKVSVIASEHTENEKKYSRSIRCMLTHMKAWQACINTQGLYLILEADFVPTKNLGLLPIPCPENQIGDSIVHIYSSAQKFRNLDKDGYLSGYSSTMVAYIVNSDSAKKLINLCSVFLQGNHNLNQYLAWDIAMPRLARGVNMRIYFPLKSYGEHGGISNPEHDAHGIRGVHRADTLTGKLHFLPQYAHENKLSYYFTRICYRLRALLRLLAGRYLEPKTLFNPLITTSVKLKMIRLALLRLVI